MNRRDYQMKPEPKTEADFTKDELALARAAMDCILEQEPELSDFGFGSGGWARPPETHEEFVQKNREQIREPRSLAQFIAARGWLKQFDKRKALNKKGSSYGLKHMAEHGVGYITNGVFSGGDRGRLQGRADRR